MSPQVPHTPDNADSRAREVHEFSADDRDSVPGSLSGERETRQEFPNETQTVGLFSGSSTIVLAGSKMSTG